MSSNAQIMFEFPGGPGVIEIHFNRRIGTGDNPDNTYEFTCDPHLMLALDAVDGLDLSSPYTRTQKYSIVTCMGLAYDRDEVCLAVALEISKYLDDDYLEIVGILDNRSSAYIGMRSLTT